MQEPSKALPPLYVDLCIIGGGVAGLSIAAGAVRHGLDVALIENARTGGASLYSGSIPSKTLRAAADAANTIRTAGKYGINVTAPDITFPALKNAVNTAISTIAPHDSQERFEGLGVKIFHETAHFTGHDRLCAGNQEIIAHNFVIATGAAPAIPEIKDLPAERILTSETIFTLNEKPEHLVLIGGAAESIELAQTFRRLGSKVSILTNGPILSDAEPEHAAILRENLRDEGIKIYENITIEKTEPRGTETIFSILQGQDRFHIDASHILAAGRRQPRTEGLDLDQAGVAYDKFGIKTDRRLRTTNKKIFAAGDVTGAAQAAHIASHHASIILRTLVFNGITNADAKTGKRALPRIIYTDPEIAAIGLNEQAAKEKYGDTVRTVKARLKENDRARAENRTEGEIKLIIKNNGTLLGVSIIAPQAAELIGLWTLAIDEKIKLGKVAALILPYPSYSELSKSAAAIYYASSPRAVIARLLGNLIGGLFHRSRF